MVTAAPVASMPLSSFRRCKALFLIEVPWGRSLGLRCDGEEGVVGNDVEQ
jgi:hypothetical protein